MEKNEKFTIVVGTDKKSILFDPTVSLSTVVYKFCETRSLDPTQYLLLDKSGNPVSRSALLGEVDGATVFLRKKNDDAETPVTPVTPVISSARSEVPELHIPSKWRRSDKRSDRRSEIRNNPKISPRGDKEEIAKLNRILLEKDNEIAKLKLQNVNLTKQLDESKKIKLKLMKNEEDVPVLLQVADELESPSTIIEERKRNLSRWKPSYPSIDTGMQLSDIQRENLRLRNEVYEANKDRKLPIMDCFTESETVSLFETEIITRILISRDLVLSPSGIHPDILTLTEFLKKGRYLEKPDYDFPTEIIKLFNKTYKSSIHTTDGLCFWLTQLVYLADWINTEYGIGIKIAAYGVDLYSVKSPRSTITVNKFWEELYKIILKIYRKLVKISSETVTPLSHKIIDHQDNSSLDELINMIDKYYLIFIKKFVCDVVVIQYFNQIYKYMDSVMFNKLLQLDKFTGQVGVNIRLAVAQLNCWKHESLKQSYPTQSGIPILPFTEIATLNFITEASTILTMDKSICTDLKFLKKHFPNLNYNHLYTFMIKCEPDDYCPSDVPTDVLYQLKAQLNNDLVIRDENLVYSVLQ